MLNQSSKITYNSSYDILHIRFGNNSHTYGKEIDDGIVLKYDIESDILVGIDIWDFKLRLNGKEEIDLPIDIDLHSIYENLLN